MLDRIGKMMMLDRETSGQASKPYISKCETLEERRIRYKKMAKEMGLTHGNKKCKQKNKKKKRR